MTKTTVKEEVKTPPTPAETNPAEDTAPEKKEQDRPWLKGEIKDEHLEEIFKIIKWYEFPAEAIQETTHPTMKKKINGYNAQYIINALNEILGMNHWREYGEMTEEKPATAFVSVYKGTFEIGNWKTREFERYTYWENGQPLTMEKVNERYFEPLIRHTTYGGSRNLDHWESLKGAKTNFLKKICSYYSLGWKSYALQLDEDFANMGSDTEAGKTTYPPKNNTKAPAGWKATPPSNKAPQQPPKAPEPPKPSSEAQIKMINNLYTEYLEKTPTGSTKTIEQLISPYKKKELKDLTSKQASEFITQFKQHVNGL